MGKRCEMRAARPCDGVESHFGVSNWPAVETCRKSLRSLLSCACREPSSSGDAMTSQRSNHPHAINANPKTTQTTRTLQLTGVTIS